MSLKKNNFSLKDRNYMRLAINLARDRMGFTKTNPPVGCVIVKNNEIISIGQTGSNGRPHAEYKAIKKSKKKIKNSTMYVSLEPCTHYGLTPPCTNEIIKSKIKKVIYAIDDIDSRTSKKAYLLLKSKKILVKKYLLKSEAKKIYKKYFFHKINKLPYITGKIACSKDKFIFSKTNNITNELSKKFSHLLRYRNEGILISSKTLNIDNSQLTCRINGLEKKSPIRFIIDRDLKSKKNSFLVKSSKRIKTILFYNKSNNKKLNYFKRNGIKLIKLRLNSHNQFDLKEVLKKVYNTGVTSLLVEGGRNLTMKFLKNNLYNEFYLFKGNHNLFNKGKLNISNILKQLSISFNSKRNIDTYLDKDQIFKYY